MAILIVGGAGYIGSHTAKLVAQTGQEPVVFDSLVHGHEWAVKWGPFVKGDLAEPAAIDAVFKAHRIEAVIHFAAFTSVGESVINPRRYYRNNLVNTLNLLDAMVDNRVRDIVFSSTAATYGDPITVPLSEAHPQVPVNPYGETKLAVENLLKWYAGAYGIRFAALRYFNAAGADPDAVIGETHDPETHLVPLAIEAALGRRPPLDVYGTDYPTPDGTAVRDYIHVDDLAEAHRLALVALQGGTPSLHLNLGTGRGHSVREVIAAVDTATGRKVPYREVARRAGDPPSLVADARRAFDTLGWKPKYPAIATIVEHAVRWHERRPRP